MSPLSKNGHTINQLIELCLEGDKYAFRKIFQTYAGKMMAICYRFSRDKHEAEDILQEGFIRVYRKLDTYRMEGSFESWIRRIMVNTAIKYRKRHITRHHFQTFDVYDPSEDGIDVLSALAVEDLMEDIKSLPEGYRTVFCLYVLEGYSHKEIAALLDFGESTSRSQLSKARKQLQSIIQKRRKRAG